MRKGLVGSCILGLTFVALGGCADDGSGPGGGGGNNRGGPDALAGFTWGMKQTIEGIEFDFGFEFGPSTISASNTCSQGGQALTATASAPVKYRYRATITKGATAGDESCHVAVNTGVIDFELAGDKLIGTSEGKTLEFTSTGVRSGLYGDWTYTEDGLTLTWSMGSGKLNISGSCPGTTVSPHVSVSANYENFVEVTQAADNDVGDDSFNCTVGIKAGTMQYRFDGATLVLTYEGQDLRLAPN